MKKAAAALLAALILGGAAAVYAAGGAAESLVSQSYLNNTYLPDLQQQAEQRVEQKTGQSYQQTLDALNVKQCGYLVQSGGGLEYAGSMTDLRVKKGDVIGLTTGSGTILLAGGGTLSSGTGIDVTAGQQLAAGAALPARHRCLAGEGEPVTLLVTSDTAVVSVEGSYTVLSGTGVDYNALADALSAMGLFRGTGTAYGKGYDLEVAPTRSVGLVMFLRLIGEEQAALSSTAVNPFIDTPAWCDRYVAYAYSKGYTKGVGTSAAGQMYFGPNTVISAGEYVTFLLRALGYSDSGTSPDFSWDNAVEKSVQFGVFNEAEQAMLEESPFLRAQVAYLSYFALSAPLKSGSGTLLDQTAAGGVDKVSAQAIMSAVTVSRIQ